MALSGRAALLAALGTLVVVGFPGWGAVLAVLFVVLAAVLVDLATAAPVRTLGLARDGAVSVRLGDEAPIVLTVTNGSGRPLRADLRDAWPPSGWRPGTAFAGSRHRLTVPAGERRRVTTTLVPTRRGDLRPVRVTVRSHGPLGLAARQGSHDVPWVLRVLPPFTSRKHLPAKLARLRELDGRTTVLSRGEGTEFDSLRAYVPGDDVRSIDWRATARQSEVAVRTWRPERDRRLLLVLDTGRTSAGRVGDAPRLDASMDAALLLTALAARAGDRVDLLAFDRAPRAAVLGVSGTEVLPAVVNALAALEPALVETDSRALVSSALSVARQRSLVVLFTDLDSVTGEAGLLSVLPRLARRHVVVVASVTDPRIEDMARERGTDAGVYGAAAAERYRAERRAAAERLIRIGVTVVEGNPGQLPPALADTYLMLKAAGRL
ncbi:DUF58 domain-containing protein [Streptomyces sp. RFCAC02]|uniref:DUF58 domain-containing protein n=1 Tax=Streptomyces sp. RFCAC02 TaxID=2499143 RepID=UPI0010203C92|nr:DUF58 domain-containing protein [Streptomyces sp. RFCAC02]